MSTNTLIAVLVLSLFCSVSHCLHRFSQIPTAVGRIKHVTASINYLWALDVNDKIYMCPQPCRSGKWKRIGGGLSQIDAGDTEVYGVNRNRYIYKRNVDGSGGWKRIAGRGLDISASGNGYVYVIGIYSRLHKCKKPCTGAWTLVDRYKRYKQVDAGYHQVYVVLRGNNRVLYKPVDGKGRWRSAGTMNSITVGGGYLYGVRSKRIYRCRLPCRGHWKAVRANLCLHRMGIREVEASVNSLVAVSSDYHLYKVPLTITTEEVEKNEVEEDIENDVAEEEVPDVLDDEVEDGKEDNEENDDQDEKKNADEDNSIPDEENKIEDEPKEEKTPDDIE